MSAALWMGPLPTISEGYLRSQLAKLVAAKAIEEISIIPGGPGQPGSALIALADLR